MNMTEDPGLFYPTVMMGQRDLNIFGVYGQYKVSGTIAAPLFPTNGIHFLVYAIGTDVVSGSAGNFTHTVTQANSLASMTIEQNEGGSESLQFTGCRVNKYSLKCDATNNEVNFSADIMGQAASVLTTPTAITVANEEPFVFAEATATLGGTTLAATNFSLDIENGLKDTYTLNGAHTTTFLTPCTRHVSGQFDVVWNSFDDATYGYWTKMFAASTASLQLVLSHSASSSVTINLPQVKLSKYADSIKMNDVVITTLNYEAELLITGPTTIGAIIHNNASAAY